MALSISVRRIPWAATRCTGAGSLRPGLHQRLASSLSRMLIYHAGETDARQSGSTSGAEPLLKARCRLLRFFFDALDSLLRCGRVTPGMEGHSMSASVFGHQYSAAGNGSWIFLSVGPTKGYAVTFVQTLQ